MTPYEILQHAYDKATRACDPIEFENRQKCLVYNIVLYLLEKDKPVDAKEKESDATN